MRTGGTFALAALLGAALALAPASAHTSETKSYVAGSGDVAIVPECDAATPVVLGGACFTVTGHRFVSSIRIDDMSGLKVGGAYRFFGAAGALGSAVVFCFTRAGPIVIPALAVQLVVFVDTLFGPLDCPNDPPGAGTTGTITVGLAH